MRSHVAHALFDLSRARQALLSVAQPALAALVAKSAIPGGRTLVLGFIAASCGYLAVFAMNDVLDERSDVDALRAGKGEFEGFDIDTAYERHPLAAGKLSRVWALGWVGVLALVAVVCAWLLNPACVALFAVSAALEVLYCSLRQRTWAKTFVSGVMVGAGALAGWVAVAEFSWRAAVFFLFMASWEIAGRNLPNDLADVGADSRVGLTTVATVYGPASSAKAIVAGSVLTTGLVAFVPLTLAQAVLSVGSASALMIVPAARLAHTPTPERAADYFNRASLLPAVVFVVVFAALLGK